MLHGENCSFTGVLDKDIVFGKFVAEDNKNEAEIAQLVYKGGVTTAKLLYKDGQRRVLLFENLSPITLKMRCMRDNVLMAIDELAKLHKLGFIHCDVHLDNFVVCGDKVYLVDFGLSYSLDKDSKFQPCSFLWEKEEKDFPGDKKTQESSLYSVKIQDIFMFCQSLLGMLFVPKQDIWDIYIYRQQEHRVLDGEN